MTIVGNGASFMSDNFNTIAGWTLAAGIVALGSSLVVGQMFHHEAVTKDGYEIAGAEGGESGGGADKPIDWTKADPAKGEKIFAQCKACHTIEAGGANGTGPNLHGILGHPKASVAGYTQYSDGLKAKGGTWTFEDINLWLTSPKKFVEGTKMTFAGISNGEKRADLIAYINAQGSNLPLPANAAPAAAEGAEAAAGGNEAAAANAAAPADNAAAPAAPAAK
jgi:cytochrome c